jgi:hypothetical protein
MLLHPVHLAARGFLAPSLRQQRQAV